MASTSILAFRCVYVSSLWACSTLYMACKFLSMSCYSWVLFSLQNRSYRRPLSGFLLIVFLSLVVFWPWSASWQPSCKCALVSSDAVCSCGQSRHFTSGCQGETNSSTSSILGPGQSVVICRIRGLCSFWSVLSQSIAFFYTRMSCWVSWPSWWSDALTRQCSSPSILIEVAIKYS